MATEVLSAKGAATTPIKVLGRESAQILCTSGSFNGSAYLQVQANGREWVNQRLIVGTIQFTTDGPGVYRVQIVEYTSGTLTVSQELNEDILFSVKRDNGEIPFHVTRLGPSFPLYPADTDAGMVRRPLHDKLLDTISVKDFGAVGDGVTDDSAAIQRGIEAIAAIGAGTLYFPAGQYYVPNNTTALRIKSSIRIVGAGMQASVIRYNDSASPSRRDCFRVFNDAGDFDITFEDIAIQSDWGAGDYAQRSHLMELHTTGTVNIHKCRFSDSSFFNVVVSGSPRVHITGCEFYRSVADGIHCSGCANVTVDGNFFQFINDDAIAVHTDDLDASPVQAGIVISNNRIIDSQGIATLGGKHVTITGNSITRAHTRAISVGAPGSVEGNTAVLSVSITGNVIDTVIDGSIFSGASGSSVWYIVVTSAVPTTNGSGYVGQRDGAGGIVSPFPYFYTNNTDAAPPVAGNWNINITGNTCTRSLGPVAQYSDYGFGARIGRSGPANPAVTAANLGSTFPQIHIRNHAQNLNIAGNMLWGGGYGIHLDGTASSAYLSWRNVTVNGNQIANFVTSGIYCEGEGVAALKNNIMDGDPLHVHAQRLPNGKWTSNTDALSCIWVAGMNIASVGNEFRNLGAIYRGATPNESAWGCNVVYCDPAVAVGWGANNIGIGNVQRALLIDSRIVIEAGDPASATYGQVLNVCQNGATVLPTTGKYPIGWYVRNTAPAVAGAASSQYIIQGWIRMTTGTGHVLNTDWREMRTLTGT